MRRRGFLLAVLAAWAASVSAQAAPRPGPRDLCPVCGMMVAKYPNWAATVVWKDGHADFFDGAKDLFRFLQDLPRYAPGRRREDIASLWVTDFYNLERMDARKAVFVIGSDVLGPMGPELVPLASQADAEDFMKDHKGRRIVGFSQVTAAILAGLDD